MNDEELYREIKSGAFSMQVADCDRNIRIQFEKQKEENEFLKSEIKEAIEYIETHKRKDEFLKLNEWETRELLKILRGETNE